MKENLGVRASSRGYRAGVSAQLGDLQHCHGGGTPRASPGRDVGVATGADRRGQETKDKTQLHWKRSSGRTRRAWERVKGWVG